MTFDQALQVANLASPILLGGIGWFLRQAMGRVTDKIESHDEQLDRLEQDMRSHRTALDSDIRNLRDTTVRREDWIRESTRTNLKLDRLLETLARLEGKVDVGAPLAVALRDLRDHMQKDEEDDAG